MSRVLLLGAGGAAAIGVTRSLRAPLVPADAASGRVELGHTVIGADSDPYSLQRAETDSRHLVPMAEHLGYIAVLNQLIDEYAIDFVHAQNDSEVREISRCREQLHARVFLPTHETVRTCQDKFASYLAWAEAGLPVPATASVETAADLRVFMGVHPLVWLRPRSGAGGRGALCTESLAMAVAWMRHVGGWGRYTVAAALTARSTTWMSLWHEGSLIAAQGRERLRWEGHSPTGVTGSTGVGMTVDDPEVERIARGAVMAVDDHPHGLFGVDLTYDRAGVPNPTEINIGRCFTTIDFITRAGLNLPHLYVQLGSGALRGRIVPGRRQAHPGLLWIRGFDAPPVLSSMDVIAAHEAQRTERLARAVAPT